LRLHHVIYILNLQRAKTKLLNNYDEELYNEIMEKKSKIIVNKLNYLYGYETEKKYISKILTQFKKRVDEIN